jgi:hypothetical protein
MSDLPPLDAEGSRPMDRAASHPSLSPETTRGAIMRCCSPRNGPRQRRKYALWRHRCVKVLVRVVGLFDVVGDVP